MPLIRPEEPLVCFVGVYRLGFIGVIMGIMEKQMETLGIIGYILGVVLSLYRHNYLGFVVTGRQYYGPYWEDQGL